MADEEDPPTAEISRDRTQPLSVLDIASSETVSGTLDDLAGMQDGPTDHDLKRDPRAVPAYRDGAIPPADTTAPLPVAPAAKADPHITQPMERPPLLARLPPSVTDTMKPEIAPKTVPMERPELPQKKGGVVVVAIVCGVLLVVALLIFR